MKLNFGIAQDKLLHMIGGAVIALAVMGISYYFHAQYYSAYGIIAALIAGGAKEYIWDASHPLTHTVDDMDWAATFIGGVLGVVGWKLGYAFIAAMLASYGVVIDLESALLVLFSIVITSLVAFMLIAWWDLRKQEPK